MMAACASRPQCVAHKRCGTIATGLYLRIHSTKLYLEPVFQYIYIYIYMMCIRSKLLLYIFILELYICCMHTGIVVSMP